MIKEPSDYDKATLQKLAEQYLVRSILDEDIYTFLQRQPNIPADKVSKFLSDGAGKLRNSVYKNINEFTNYSASSLLRYWASMIEICHKYKLPTEEIPSLDSLLTKYKHLLEFINQISVEHELESLINAHKETVWRIYSIYINRSENLNKPLTVKEVALLNEIAEHQFIKGKISEGKNRLVERMREI